MKHNIVMTCEAKTPDALLLKRQIRKCILAALDEEGVDTPCEINDGRCVHPRDQQGLPEH